MSIATSLAALQTAKTNIAAAITAKGVTVNTGDGYSDFADLISACPTVVYGSFTPETDTDTFAVSGLSFAPNTLYLSCEALEATVVNDSWIKIIQSPVCGAGYRLCWTADGTLKSVLVVKTSSAFTWTDNSVTFASSASTVFRAGYTYRYIISGGVQ